jgi:hypothetical protein
MTFTYPLKSRIIYDLEKIVTGLFQQVNAGASVTVLQAAAKNEQTPDNETRYLLFS